ncbi:MAG: MBOAT family O-acyltransferase, partial [Eubacteriales bacterium]|nr:MBOAT family O-acyltransferase [Eubacteriales bacterium]
MLIVFSLLFYAWGEPVRIVVMVFSVCLNWLCGLMVSRSENRGIRRAWMLIGVGVSLGTLVYFKYFAFMAETVCVLLGVSYKGPEVTLPIGMSFYTFQVLTYTIDVWRGKVEVQRSLPRLMMYVSFFPQLIAGPIVNYKDIEKSLGARVITGADFHAGMLRFLDGFAKKVLLANLCGELLEQLLPSGESMSVLSAWLSAVVFGLQIYFDFSGYSDMAIGMGRMFGFRFRENFDHPYMSSSVSEFWRRWHISLG